MSIGFHMQLPTNGWLDAVERLPAGTPVKAVNDGGMLVEAKQRNPGVFTILRHWYDEGQVFGGSLEENKARARAFFNSFVDGTFRDQYAPYIDAIEEFNEYFDDRHVPNAQREWMKQNFGLGYNPEYLPGEHQDRLTWIQAVNEVWTSEYRTSPELAHIRLVTGNVPIGNSVPLAYAQIVQQHDGLLGYHPYIYTVNGSPAPEDALYLSGRWIPNDAYFRANGVTVQWVGTEGGVYGSVIDGWKSPGVCGGNLECYLNALHYFCQRVRSWNQVNGHRFRGCVLFTTLRPDDNQWGSYHVQQPEMNALADLAAQYPIGATEPPPPGPPPPPPGPPPPPPPPPPGKWNKVVYLMPQDTTPAEYDAVQAVAYPTRSEIAFSANSAFSRPGDVGTHKVVVYAVERWGGKAALEQWVQQQGYTYNPATVIEYRSMPPVNPSFALVADISQHQGEVNFSTMKSKGVTAVIMRGPMGKAGMDQRMEQYHQQAGAAGLPRGMYALWRPEWNAEEQAQHAANVYLSRDWELPPAGDFEIPAPDGRNLAAEIHAYLLAFESITGVRMRIYTSASWWNANVGTTPWAAGYALWTAGYPNPQHTMHEPGEYWPGYTPKGWPVDGWRMWQFTTIEPGSDWGVQSARLDLNWEKV